MQTIRIDAPKNYGNAMLWAMQQVIHLEDYEHKTVHECRPITNDANELVAIEVVCE